MKLMLRCKGNRKKGLWLLAKVKDSYAQYMHDDYKDEAKYINSLSDDNKEWLNDFLLGYYHRSKPAFERLKFPVMLRRARYNQHRGVVADIYNHRNRVYPERYEDGWDFVNLPESETNEGTIQTHVIKKRMKQDG